MQPSCRGPPQPPPASWSPGEDYVSSAPSITSCIAVSFAEGALSLLPVLIKKLYAQEVSLFCVFKTGAGVAYGVICFFRPGAPSRNLLLFFQNAACRAVPGDRAPRAAIKPAATAHQSAN